MKFFTSTVLALALGVSASHAAPKWTTPGIVASAIVGISADSSGTSYTAAGDNGGGAEILISSDGAQTFTPGNISTAFMFLDTGASKTTKGSVVANGLFGGQYSSDGVNFVPSVGAGGQGQSVESFGDSNYGITTEGGVLISSDNGKTFKNIPFTGTDANHPGRYGAFPSATTWYVSTGQWPESMAQDDESSVLVKALSEKLEVRQNKDTKEYFTKVHTEFRGNANNATGYYGSIIKTTDGGKTWDTVYQQDGTFYFNGIDCSTEDHCIAVAEGHNVQPAGAYAFVTQDGGKTWNNTLSDMGGSLMGSRMVSDTEGWITGSNNGKSANGVQGTFWHTTDGGLSWDLDTIPGLAGISIDCTDSTHCFAGAVNAILQQGTVASYK